MKPRTNERTFQGILLSSINEVLSRNTEYQFKKITQEQQVGIGNQSRFSDALLTTYNQKTISFELKNTSWDATEEQLVQDAAQKATNNGFEFFVTGTPRQLVLWKTFEAGTNLYERKLKIFTLSNKIRKNDDILTPIYEKELFSNLKNFLNTLHKVIYKQEENWNSIDEYFVSKLSVYICEASENMFFSLSEKIKEDKKWKKKIEDYLKVQDIFNIKFQFEEEDNYNICKLANYLLYLKIIFYSYLQREVQNLKLKPLEIPEKTENLNRVFRNYFDEVLNHDFEMIFESSVLDELEFTQDYIPSLKRNIEEIQKLDFKDLNCDIIGMIYNKLIDNQEQHDKGQHFTNVQEVDIINGFCIDEKTNLLLDSGCGAGTFLVRAYQFLKDSHKEKNHLQLLEKLWGIEISPFPSFLSVMNLCLLNIKDFENYPIIIREDFSNIFQNQNRKILFKNKNQDKTLKIKKIDNQYSQVKIPKFDACIGNPPYIRQESISNSNKQKWNDLILADFQIKKFNKRSDLYCYYLIHTASFLKEGGRLGYVVSSSWLDVAFGKDLIHFLLSHFKIIAILDNQKKRSFETASVNTVILILEKCSEQNERNENLVRFVRIIQDYESIIGHFQDTNRIERVKRFTHEIENIQEEKETKDFLITIKKQESFLEEPQRNWGAKYLRSPKIYNKILQQAKEKLIPLKEIVQVKYGIKTGANDFFYVKDDTNKISEMSDTDYKLHFGFERKDDKTDWNKFGWYDSKMSKRHFVLDRKFFQPIFKSSKEAEGLQTKAENCQFKVFICNESKEILKKNYPKTFAYIQEAEEKGIDKRETCESRISEHRDWYMLLGENDFVGDFIFQSKFDEKFRLIENQEKLFCDKVNYNITIQKDYVYYKKEIFCLLNSTLFRYFLDLFSRQLTGNLTISDADVNVVEDTLIPNPELFSKHKQDFDKIYHSLLKREQESIFEEVKKVDRKKLDEIIFQVLGLPKKDVQELYKSVCDYIKNRREKSDSVSKSKSKQKLSKEQGIEFLKERYKNDITSYSDLIKSCSTKNFSFYDRAKFPKEAKDFSVSSDNLFQKYQISFPQKKTTIDFEHLEQMQLYYFFYNFLEFRGELELPTDENSCREILKQCDLEFQEFFPKIQETIKRHRIVSVQAIEVYRVLQGLNL